MPGAVELETPRLRLRQWCDADLVPFAALCSDPRVMEFSPASLSREASGAMALRCQALIAERGWGLWAVEEKYSSEFIGFVGLHIPTAVLPFNPCVEIGWRLAAAYWGKGYATEAAQAALKFAFDTLQLQEVVSFTSVLNTRSQAVMQRLGLQLAGTFQHPSIAPENPLAPHVWYRISKSENRRKM